jgi:hypothetical protein
MQEVYSSKTSPDPSLQRLQQVHLKNGPSLSLVSVFELCKTIYGSDRLSLK